MRLIEKYKVDFYKILNNVYPIFISSLLNFFASLMDKFLNFKIDE